MSSHAARLLCLPVGLLALVANVAGKLWVIPLTWRLDSGLASMSLYMGWLAASFLVPVGFHRLVIRAARRQREQLVVSAGRFVAPASPGRAGQYVILLGWTAGGLIPAERVPNEERMHVATFSAVLLVVAGALLALSVVLMVLGTHRPFLALGQEGVTLRGMLRRTSVGWDHADPVHPTSVADDGSLRIHRLAVGGAAPTRLKVPVAILDVEPAFLAAAIRHYVEHPEHRHGIGTPDELRRLLSKLRT